MRTIQQNKDITQMYLFCATKQRSDKKRKFNLNAITVVERCFNLVPFNIVPVLYIRIIL